MQAQPGLRCCLLRLQPQWLFMEKQQGKTQEELSGGVEKSIIIVEMVNYIFKRHPVVGVQERGYQPQILLLLPLLLLLLQLPVVVPVVPVVPVVQHQHQQVLAAQPAQVQVAVQQQQHNYGANNI